jgi:hypothetical protein
MAFVWGAHWSDAGNHNGATQDQVVAILATARMFGTGDAGLRDALAAASGTVTIEKGIHQDNNLHIRVFYLGGTWHVNMVPRNGGGVGDYRVGAVTQ